MSEITETGGMLAPIVLTTDRHLKWRALDGLERVLMILCGLCLAGFSTAVFLDVLTREIRTSLALAAGSDVGFLHLRHLLRHLGRRAAQRPSVSIRRSPNS